MASPVAHSLAGAIIYLTSRRDGRAERHDFWWLILAANLADFDLIPSVLMGDHNLFHRTLSHSISASLVFAGVVYTVCWWRERPDPGRMTMLMLAAYLSQLLLDWMSLDPGPVSGIPVLWPFSHAHYMADPAVFLNIERNELFSAATIVHNLKAVLLEAAILGPPAALLWWWQRERNDT